MVAAAGLLEVWALASPGVEDAAGGASTTALGTARSVVSLVMLWAAIGFLVVYVRKLRAENARVRGLRAEADGEG